MSATPSSATKARIVNQGVFDSIIADALVMFAAPLPHVTAITPKQTDRQIAPLIHITGRDFIDPSKPGVRRLDQRRLATLELRSIGDTSGDSVRLAAAGYRFAF